MKKGDSAVCDGLFSNFMGTRVIKAMKKFLQCRERKHRFDNTKFDLIQSVAKKKN